MRITPNQLSVLRIILAFVTFYFIFSESLIARFAAFILFTIAGLTDLWDGFLARLGGMVTSVGKILDPIADKILVLGAMISFSILGIYPFWVLVPIIFREVLVTALRIYLLGKNIVVAAEKSGKIKVASQMVSLFVTYVCLLNRDYAHSYFSAWPGWADTITVFANYFFLAVATWFTLVSGWEFLKHNRRHLRA